MTDRSVRVRLSLSHSDFSRGLATVAAETSAFTKNLDTSNNRMSALIQTGIALGPALVPVMGAVAAGGIGMAEALGATAVGAGVAVLAFHGVGDALKALNTFALDPTAEHLQTVHEKMAALGPDGKQFVFMLQSLRPELERLQSSAAHGLLPGVTEGLDHLLTVQPQVEALVSNIAGALGDVAAEGGQALASPFWTDFLDFLATDGRDSMVTMLNIIGQLMKATASLIMAFDPLSQDIGGALLEKTQELAKWADQLDQSQGFQDFTDWMERVGPKVWDTLGAIGEALVEIVKAAAPVGEITLPILTALAEAIASIAASPAGPALIGVAVAINALSRAMALWRVTTGGGALGAMLFGPSLSKDATEAEKAAASTARLAGVMRIAAGAAALYALSLTNVDEKLGVSNMLTYGAMGAMTGNPFIAAAGFAAGAVIDQRARDAGSSGGWGPLAGGWGGVMEHAREINTLRLASNQAVNQMPTNFAIGPAQRGLGGIRAAGMAPIRGNLFNPTALAGSAARMLGPAIQLGDSTVGKTQAVAAAFAELNKKVIDTTTSAQDLQTALDGLLDPNMNLEAATDAYTTALRHWEKELAHSSKTLVGNSDAAIKNRTAVRGRVDLLKQQLEAEANAGWGTDRLTNSMQKERQALLDAGKAAGLNRGEMRDLLHTYGLTPKLIKTLVEANTDSAKRKILEIQRLLNGLHDRNITVGVAFDRGIGPGQNVGPTGGNAYGGQVLGPGGPTDDKVLRRLSNREWVQPVSAVDYYGPDFMRAVQHRTLPKMAGGGPVSWFADGTSRGSRLSMGYGARTSVAGDARSGEMKISGRLTLGADGTAYIRGIVRDEMSGDSEFVASAARQRGS